MLPGERAMPPSAPGDESQHHDGAMIIAADGAGDRVLPRDLLSPLGRDIALRRARAGLRHRVLDPAEPFV